MDLLSLQRGKRRGKGTPSMAKDAVEIGGLAQRGQGCALAAPLRSVRAQPGWTSLQKYL